MTKWVKHDEVKWRVTGEHQLDDLPAYTLLRLTPVRVGTEIIGWKQRKVVAYQRDCEPVTSERKRRFRDAGGVIEFDARGNITLREAGRRKRYTTTISGLLSICARQEALNKKRDRDFKRRTKK